MGMFDQIKDVMKMRSEAKRIQAKMQSITADYSNGGITVVAKGDLTISKIEIAPEAYDEVKAGKPQRFETMLSTSSMARSRKSRISPRRK